MTDHEQIIIYDTMVQIQERAPVLCELLNERSTPAERDAYKRGIYAAVVRLGSLFTPEERSAHEERHRKIKEECDAFFAAKANAQMCREDSVKRAQPSDSAAETARSTGSGPLRGTHDSETNSHHG